LPALLGRLSPSCRKPFLQVSAVRVASDKLHRVLAGPLKDLTVQDVRAALKKMAATHDTPDAAEGAQLPGAGDSARGGVYRFWRDAGYALGALIGGITAVLASLDTAILVATILTAASGLLAWAVMDETHPAPHARHGPPS
jgi:hypothetical protein